MNEGEKEDAAKREVMEETPLHIELTDVLGVHTEPNRDHRDSTISTLFVGGISHDVKIAEPVAQDDAVEVV